QRLPQPPLLDPGPTLLLPHIVPFRVSQAVGPTFQAAIAFGPSPVVYSKRGTTAYERGASFHDSPSRPCLFEPSRLPHGLKIQWWHFPERNSMTSPSLGHLYYDEVRLILST
ncbi:hypothetical protein U1Q18_020644, partial [Sarracenia purpurea var. burkii]